MEVTASKKAPGPIERKWVGRMVRSFFRFHRSTVRPAPLTLLPWTPVRFEGNSGADVAARWFHQAHSQGVVVLAHPDRRSGQQWFLPQGWIEFLLDHGFEVLTFDFAGYGDTRGGSTYLLEDAIAACRFAKQRANGKPVHLVGVSLGAFSAINAAPHLDFLDGLVLESPFPTFNSWYGRGWGKFAMAFFDALFPRTAKLIQADQNIRLASAKRILIAAAKDDAITPTHLTRRVLENAPADRTTYLEVEGARHLGLFLQSERYREAILRTLGAQGS